MGQLDDSFALVIMTNKDLYRVTVSDAREIKKAMAEPSAHKKSFETVDAKSGSEISITIAVISSVVIPKGVRRG
jgi:diaminopimelate epimerase